MYWEQNVAQLKACVKNTWKHWSQWPRTSFNSTKPYLNYMDITWYWKIWAWDMGVSWNMSPPFTNQIQIMHLKNIVITRYNKIRVSVDTKQSDNLWFSWYWARLLAALLVQRIFQSPKDITSQLPPTWNWVHMPVCYHELVSSNHIDNK